GGSGAGYAGAGRPPRLNISAVGREPEACWRPAGKEIPGSGKKGERISGHWEAHPRHRFRLVSHRYLQSAAFIKQTTAFFFRTITRNGQPPPTPRPSWRTCVPICSRKYSCLFRSRLATWLRRIRI